MRVKTKKQAVIRTIYNNYNLWEDYKDGAIETLKANDITITDSAIWEEIYNQNEYDCDGNKLIDFVKAHKETFCMTDYEKELYIDILDCIEETGYLFELLEDYSCDTTGFNGIGAVISNIMSRETGVRFEYYPGEDACYTPNAICFTRSFPWLFNEIEKNLTRDKLEDICGKYMNELGITDKFSFLELEYFG